MVRELDAENSKLRAKVEELERNLQWNKFLVDGEEFPTAGEAAIEMHRRFKERDAKARELWEELKKSEGKAALFVLQAGEQLAPDDLYASLRRSLMEEQNTEGRLIHSPSLVDPLVRWLIFESSDKTRSLIAHIHRSPSQCPCCGCAPGAKHSEGCTEKGSGL